MVWSKWTRCAAVAVLISGMCLGQVTASRPQPNQERMLERAKGFVERGVEEDGQEYVDMVYSQVSHVVERHRHPIVRFFMLDLQGWMETKFGAGNLAWRNEGFDPVKHGSALAKEDEVTVVTAQDTILNTVSPHVTLDIVERPTPIKEISDDDLYKQESINLPQSSQYYQLDEGRIDMVAVQIERLKRVNKARSDRNLPAYTIDKMLERTATERSIEMRNKESADHKRFSTSSYYDYGQITDRFAKRGVEFENIERSTYTENVGYARFDCDKLDCTDDAISALRRIFDYFMSEEGKAYDVHYRTIVHPRYEVMGMSIAIDEENNWIYSAQHYGTKVM